MIRASFHSTVHEGKGQGGYFLRCRNKIDKREEEEKRVKEDVGSLKNTYLRGICGARTGKRQRNTRVHDTQNWSGREDTLGIV